MERTYVKDIKAGKTLLVKGWVADVRDLGAIKFVLLRDRTGTIQITASKKKCDAEILRCVDNLTRESVIIVSGKSVKNAQAPNGIEVLPAKIELVSKAETPLPIDISTYGKTAIDKRLDWRFLDLRQPKNAAIFKISSKILKHVANFFDSEGFVAVNTPKITACGVESGADLFPVVYFNKEAFLAQSPQIYKQMMVAAGFEKVYEIGAVYRAEKSHTTRHVTEFTGIDMEMGFIKDENDVMDIVEKLVKYLVEHIKKDCSEELRLLDIKLEIPKKIPRIMMKEAKDMLAKKNKVIVADEDLDAEGEKLLGELIKANYKSDLVFVTHYPWTKRPFYHMRPQDDSRVTRSFDLIWNGLEVATGAQREHRYEILKKQAEEKNVNLDSMQEYAAIFKYGCPPHGGVGLGLARILESMLKLDNVREAILLPRDPERLRP